MINYINYLFTYIFLTEIKCPIHGGGMMAEDEEFSEEETTGTDEQKFDEDVDNDEITPGEEGFLQGYEATEEKEEKPAPKEEEE